MSWPAAGSKQQHAIVAGTLWRSGGAQAAVRRVFGPFSFGAMHRCSCVQHLRTEATSGPAAGTYGMCLAADACCRSTPLVRAGFELWVLVETAEQRKQRSWLPLCVCSLLTPCCSSIPAQSPAIFVCKHNNRRQQQQQYVSGGKFPARQQVRSPTAAAAAAAAHYNSSSASKRGSRASSTSPAQIPRAATGAAGRRMSADYSSNTPAGFACPAVAASPKPEALPMPTGLMSRALAVRSRSPSPPKDGFFAVSVLAHVHPVAA